MLKTHMDAIEKQLMASYKISGNAGHSLHKGTPREGFIKDFLLKHIGKQVSVGSGELIDCRSETGQQRNQHDIVIHQNAYPRIHFGEGIDAFLAESVVATIEVKSLLTKDDLKQAVIAASRAKTLEKHIRRQVISNNDKIPPRTYVVAYNGPASLETVYNWIAPIHTELSIEYPPFPHPHFRDQMISPSIDGVFLLGTGFLYFGNTKVGFLRNEDIRQFPDTRWIYANQSEGSLLLLFLLLTEAISDSTGIAFDPLPYAVDFIASDLCGGP